MPRCRRKRAPLGARMTSAFLAVGSRLPDQSQRIDLEGADDARVQAPEVEHQHVLVQPRLRGQDVPALLALPALGGILVMRDPDGGGHHAPFPQARQVQEVEGGDGGAGAVGRHAGEQAALHGERHQLQLLQDVEGEARVGEVVPHEPLRIPRKGALDLGGVVDGGERLALAQDVAGGGLQAVVRQPQPDGAQQADAVQHRPPRDEDRVAEPAGAAVALAELPGRAAQLQRHAGGRRPPNQDRDVEVDDAPTGQHVGIELADSPAEEGQQLRLVRARGRAARAGGAGILVRTPQQHLLSSAAPQRHGVDLLRLGIGLQVQRQRGQLRRPVRGFQRRLVEHHGAGPLARGERRVPVDADGAADASIDEVAVGEAHVRLIGGGARTVQPLAQPRRLLRVSQLDAMNRRTVQRAQLGRRGPRARGLRPQPVGVLYVEVGRVAAVADQERAAILQPAVQMDDRAAARAGRDVGGVEDVADEPAHRVPVRSAAVFVTL